MTASLTVTAAAPGSAAPVLVVTCWLTEALKEAPRVQDREGGSEADNCVEGTDGAAPAGVRETALAPAAPQAVSTRDSTDTASAGAARPGRVSRPAARAGSSP